MDGLSIHRAAPDDGSGFHLDAIRCKKRRSHPRQSGLGYENMCESRLNSKRCYSGHAYQILRINIYVVTEQPPVDLDKNIDRKSVAPFRERWLNVSHGG